jgi:indoleamine 2,3-dioxygenase
MIHVQIERQAGPAIAALPVAQASVVNSDSAALAQALASVATALEKMHSTLRRMPENCDPYIYYNRVRPFIHGWQQSPVVYEGVPEYASRPQVYYGETGAQSSIVPCLDAVLGVQHRPDELRAYLIGMRTYMPAPHRLFLEQLEQGPSVRDFVLAQDTAELDELYDACLAGLSEFRSTHLEFAARYIQHQAQVGANSTAYGTGGTPFMRYLRKHRDETGRQRAVARHSP